MPLSFRPDRVFYGWWIVSAAFVVTLYSGGAQFYGFTAFFEPIAHDFGWSYAQISFASSLRGLEEGIFVPLVGMLADRFGPRRLMFSGGLIAAAGFVLLGQVNSLPVFYLAYAIAGAGISCCTTTTIMTALANWFRGRVGLASGIALSGFGFSGLLIPLIVWLIEAFGWRMAVNILALGMLGIIVPLSLVFRHKPEPYGYLPDGRTESPVAPNDPADVPRSTEINVGVKRAYRSGIFWIMVLAFTYHSAVVSTIVTHVMPYLSSVGVSRYTASLVATGIPLASVLGRLGLGWLGDRHDRRKMAALGFGMMGASLLLFAYVSASGVWLLPLSALLFGVGYGGATSMRVALGRECFGRANFGAIFGLLMGINTTVGMVGPIVAGWAYDNWGSYQGTWLVFAGLAVVALVLVLTVPQAHDIDKTSE